MPMIETGKLRLICTVVSLIHKDYDYAFWMNMVSFLASVFEILFNTLGKSLELFQIYARPQTYTPI